MNRHNPRLQDMEDVLPHPHISRNKELNTKSVMVKLQEADFGVNVPTLQDESDEDLVDEDDIVDLGNDGVLGNENLEDYSE
ncbi:hypothetical protein Tco_0435250 [Tanacetum coccineum]